MDDKNERELRLIERAGEAKLEKHETSHHTNPIMKKFLAFHLEKASKLNVKDLFKK